MEGQEFDIDISGNEGELPPGVEQGSLGGTDEPEEAPTAVTTTADELDASFDAALDGDDDFGEAPEEEPEVVEGPTGVEHDPMPPPGMNGPAPPQDAEVVPAVVPAPEAPKKRPPKGQPKKQPKKRPPKRTPGVPNASGPAARLYAIFQKHQVEIDGRIMEAFVRIAFADPDNPQGAPMEAIRARNRDTALYKAGKLFGHGFEGTLVATPVTMWEEKPVRNHPREHFHVEVGT